MPIRTVGPNDMAPRMEVLTIPPDRWVQFMGGPEHCIKVYLHIFRTQSSPCMGLDCKICPLPARQYAYAPVLEMFAKSEGIWQTRKAILPITAFAFELADIDQTGKLLKIGRKNGKKNGRIIWEVRKEIEKCHEAPFDVMRCMEARWGLLSNDRAPLPEEDEEYQGSLPFPEVG